MPRRRTPPEGSAERGRPTGRPSRVRRADVTVAAGLALLTAALYLAGLFERLEIIAIDFRYHAFPAPVRPDILLVLIDALSLKRIGQWPWPRGEHARLIGGLRSAGARAIGYDVEFGRPRERADDARLAAAVAEARNVVLAVFQEQRDLPGGAQIYAGTPLMGSLREIGAAAGTISFPQDAGGGIRRGFLTEAVGGDPYWAFSVELVRQAEGLPPDRVRWAGPGRLLLGAHTIRGDRRGLVYIDYAGGRGTFSYVPAADVLDGRVRPEDIRGKVVLVGASAIELQDLHPSPFPGVMPGVEIQANLVNGFLRGVAARRLPPWMTLLALTLLAASWLQVAARVVGGTARPSTRTLRLAAAAGLGAAGTIALAAFLFWRWRLFLDVVPLAAAAVAMGVATVIAEGVRTGRRATLSTVALAPAGAKVSAGASPLDQAVDVLFAGLRDWMGVEALVLDLPHGVPPPEVVRMVRTTGSLRLGADSPACRDAARRAIAEREGFLLERVGQAFAPAAPGAPRMQAVGSAFVPLVVDGRAIGVLQAHRGSTPFEADDLRVMSALAAQLALTVQNLNLMQDLRQFHLGTMATLADAVEARDASTGGHCKRVSDLSVRLAQAAGLSPAEVEDIRIGSLVHDIGKIGISDKVLGKPGPLTPEEIGHVQEHTVIGGRIIAQLPVSQMVRDVVVHHHERYDGTGYPGGLRGEQIPISARIVAIVDAYEAMTSRRVYKRSVKPESAREELRRSEGTHLDPSLVERFLHLLETEGDPGVSADPAPGDPLEGRRASG